MYLHSFWEPFGEVQNHYNTIGKHSVSRRRQTPLKTSMKTYGFKQYFRPKAMETANWAMYLHYFWEPFRKVQNAMETYGFQLVFGHRARKLMQNVYKINVLEWWFRHFETFKNPVQNQVSSLLETPIENALKRKVFSSILGVRAAKTNSKPL